MRIVKNYLVEVLQPLTEISESDFKNTFRELICARDLKAECKKDCVLSGRCIFFATFIEKKDFGARLILQGDKYCLTLSERASEFLPYFIRAIKQIAKVKRVEKENYLVYDGEKDEFFPTEETKEMEHKEKLQKLLRDIERQATEISSLRQQLSNRDNEIVEVRQQLYEIRREQQTKEEIAAAMAKLLATESKLALANLKLAVRKAIADLVATKKVFKSRSLAQIHKDLEAAINPPAEDSCDG